MPEAKRHVKIKKLLIMGAPLPRNLPILPPKYDGTRFALVHRDAELDPFVNAFFVVIVGNRALQAKQLILPAAPAGLRVDVSGSGSSFEMSFFGPPVVRLLERIVRANLDLNDAWDLAIPFRRYIERIRVPGVK